MNAQLYIDEALGMADAVDAVCEARRNTTVYAIGMLASHSLELGLKAYLVSTGYSKRKLKKIGHDIGAAWAACIDDNLELEEMPYWVQVLDFSHSNPFFFRYPNPDHGVAIPNCEELSHQLREVLVKISSKISA